MNLNPVFAAQWLSAIPNYYPLADQDPKATGVRRKKLRFEELLTKWLGMTAGAIDIDLSTILPDMPKFTVESWTQTSGWGAVVKKNDTYHFVSGVNAGFIGEFTEYFMPKGVIVSSPYATNIDGEYIFGKNAVLLRNDTNMQGLLPLLAPLAELQIESNVSMLQAIENLRIVNVFHAKTDRMKEAVLSFLKQIRWGRSGFITGEDSKVKWSGSSDSPVIEALPHSGVPSNYIVQFIEASQYVRATLFNEIGLQANGNLKRESLTDSETSLNDDTLRPIIDNMLECRKQFVDDLNETFGLEIPEPELAGAWKVRKLESSIVEKSAEEVISNEDTEGDNAPELDDRNGDNELLEDDDSDTTLDDNS